MNNSKHRSKRCILATNAIARNLDNDKLYMEYRDNVICISQVNKDVIRSGSIKFAYFRKGILKVTRYRKKS
jgi:hypothetical protein